MIPIRRVRASARGVSISRSSIVAGSTVASLFVPSRLIHGRPFESTAMPYGRARGVGTGINWIRPVRFSNLPTRLLPCAVNQMSPFGSKTRVCGSRAAGSGIGYFVTSPVRGSSLPMCAARFPAYHTVPSASTMRLCGPVPGSSSWRQNSPERGSSTPT